MAEFPYCANATSVRKFMDNIQIGAVPRRVGPKYMEGLGFKGSDGRALVSILKALGFLSAAGVPAERWRAYRDRATAPKTMAEALHETYADVFEAYPDAHRKEDSVLISFFGTQADVAHSTLVYMVRTFRTLCTLADFEARARPVGAGLSLKAREDRKPMEERPIQVVPPLPASDPANRPVTLNVTVQLQLPATDDPKVYEALFAALRKYLMS